MAPWVTAIAGNVPSLVGFAILSWYLFARLRKCEDARDSLTAEHTRLFERMSDLRVRVAVLETRNDNAAVVAAERTLREG